MQLGDQRTLAHVGLGVLPGRQMPAPVSMQRLMRPSTVASLRFLIEEVAPVPWPDLPQQQSRSPARAREDMAPHHHITPLRYHITTQGYRGTRIRQGACTSMMWGTREGSSKMVASRPSSLWSSLSPALDSPSVRDMRDSATSPGDRRIAQCPQGRRRAATCAAAAGAPAALFCVW